MQKVTALLAAVSILSGLGLLGQEKKAPAKLVFKAKNGDVTFNHAEHVKRAGGDCKTCHPALWPQSATAPLNFKAGMHKPAEAKQTSCGSCHHPGASKAFPTAGNCNKCHHRGTT